MKTKVFKTIDEQINILQERGLTIDDIDFAKEELIREVTLITCTNGNKNRLILKAQEI